MVDQQIVYVVGNAGTILKSTDGGLLWIRQFSGTTNNLHAVSFADANHGVAVGDMGTTVRERRRNNTKVDA
jgi:photosystem II stability/assembly factor-like uncharacterized protein